MQLHLFAIPSPYYCVPRGPQELEAEEEAVFGTKSSVGPSLDLRRAMVSAPLREKLKFSSSLSSILCFTELTRGLVMIFTAGFKSCMSFNLHTITAPKLF